MQIRTLDPAAMTRSYDMLLSPLLSPEDVGRLALGSAFGLVQAGTRTKPHLHHECELFVILEGAVDVGVGNEVERLRAGQAVLIAPFERHWMTNPSPAESVKMISVYWDNMAAAITAANDIGDLTSKPTHIITPPPTPNGGLHLGHLAGPYLRADAYRRILATLGIAATLSTGTDDHQSYVDVAAVRLGVDPRGLARMQGDAVLRTMAKLAIEPHSVVRPDRRSGYAAMIERRFAALVASSCVRRTAVATLYCDDCGRSLYEGYLSGRCPICQEASSGQLCEACGLPNGGTDLLSPRCAVCGAVPRVQTEPAFVLDLQGCAETLAAYHRSLRCSDHVRALLERCRARGFGEFRLTRRGRWGIASTLEDQLIDPWVELMLAYPLYIKGASDSERVLFLGYDNAFFYAVLLPALLAALGEISNAPTALMSNEFLLYEGEKFSTSREHAIWADDLLAKADPDTIRFALLQCSPEVDVDDFTSENLLALLDGSSVAPLAHWLDGFHGVATAIDSVAVAAGAWTTTHKTFFAELTDILTAYAQLRDPEAFSTRAYTALIIRLVEHGLDFRAATRYSAEIESLSEEQRTTSALELLAARVFATIAAPAMPNVANRVADALGLQEKELWADLPRFISAGTTLCFSSEPHFKSIGIDAHGSR